MTSSTSNERVFIDRFIVPVTSKSEFLERLTINRELIKGLPGFIQDSVFEKPDHSGNLMFVTVAVWTSEEAINDAKQAVQAEYRKQGFDLAAMLERLRITFVERGIYSHCIQ